MKHILISAAILSAAGSVAMADSMPAETLTFLDENADAIVTIDEYVSGLGKLYGLLDANGNGRIEWSEAEVTMSRDLFDAADTDGNAVMTKGEYDARLRKDFAAADKDGDGVLD
jgi:hypothetical protein